MLTRWRSASLDYEAEMVNWRDNGQFGAVYRAHVTDLGRFYVRNARHENFSRLEAPETTGAYVSGGFVGVGAALQQSTFTFGV